MRPCASFVLLGLLAACGGGERSAALARAREALAAGEGARALAELQRLVTAGGEQDPELQFDLGVAAAAAGREDTARRHLAEALLQGGRPVRARALLALAALDAAALLRQAAGAPEALRGESRLALRSRAESVLARLQAARELDPEAVLAATRQDAIALWMRVVEDAWARADLEAAQAHRRARIGAAFFAAVQEGVRDLARGLAARELLATLAIQAQALAQDLDLAEEKLGEVPLLDASARTGLHGMAASARETLEALARAFESGEPEALAPALLAGELALLPLLVQISDLEGSLLALGGGVESLARARSESALGLAAARSLESGRLASAIQVLFEDLPRRCASEGLPEPLSRFLAGEIPALRAEAEPRAEEPDAEAARLQRLASRIASLLGDLRLARAAAADLAAALGGEAHALGLALEEDPEARAPVQERLQALARRAEFLPSALERSLSRDSEEGGTVPPPPELLESLMALCDAAGEAGRRAAASLEEDPPRAAASRAALAEAEHRYEELWAALAPLVPVAERAAEHTAALVAENHAARRLLRPRPEPLPSEIRTGPLAPERQRQRLERPIGLARTLEARLLALALGPPEAEAGETQAPKSPQTEEEQAFHRGLAAKAREAAGRLASAGEDLAGADPSAGAAVMEEAFRRALGDEALAETRLREIADELRRREAALLEIAARVMDADHRARAALASGRVSAGEPRAPARRELLRGLAEATRPWIRGLDRALQRALEDTAQPGHPDATPERRAALARELEARDRELRKEAFGASPERLIELVQARRDAARELWRRLADREGLTRRAIEEEDRIVAGLEAATGGAPDSESLVETARADQDWLRELGPDLRRLWLEARETPAAPAPGGAGAPAEDPGRKKAERLLPEIEAAMVAASERAGAGERAEALERAGVAARLLRELLESESDQDQDSPSQGKGAGTPQPDPGSLSPAERDRLLRAVAERSRKLEEKLRERRPPTPVAEDW
jgi:hypothetical protein